MNIELGKNINPREIETKIQEFWDNIADFKLRIDLISTQTCLYQLGNCQLLIDFLSYLVN